MVSLDTPPTIVAGSSSPAGSCRLSKQGVEVQLTSSHRLAGCELDENEAVLGLDPSFVTASVLVRVMPSLGQRDPGVGEGDVTDAVGGRV